MKLKKIISTMLSAAMVFSCGIIPANAQNFVSENTGTAENKEETLQYNIDYQAKQSGEDTAYLFAYFRRPEGGRDDERLCYGVSRDGYTFRSLNGGEPVFTSTLGTGHLRDPFIFEGEDGYFYIVVTDMDSAKGWASQSTMAIYKTKDLINIDDSILVDYKQFEGFDDCTRAWAPQVIWCPEHENADGTAGAYMVYISLMKDSTKDDIGTVLYKQFTTDLMDKTKYTVPEFMITGEEDGIFAKDGAIDGDIIYDSVNSRWLMYFDGFRIASSDKVDGTYAELESGSPIVNIRIEGSNMFKVMNEDRWIICADGQSFGTGFNVYATSDFNSYENIKSEVDYDFAPRHGYVIPINEEELARLMNEYGEVYLPNKNNPSPLDNLELPYTAKDYKITGNITLPEEFNGADISWTSSNEDVINTEKTELSDEEKQKYGENYTEIPAGIVHRQESDTDVTLTASAEGRTRNYKVTVKAAPEKTAKQMEEDGDYKGYLYASFIEPPKDASGQQVYFASSDDGRNWSDLNDNKPVLTSAMGTGSTRDHYILRSPEGDRFYIIATDLNCFSKGGDWTQYAQNGSKYLMVWESDDLVNWSKQRMVKVADDKTGCAWAPEAIYDEITGEYIVYWSGTDMEEGSSSYGKKVVYYSKTRDFYSFGEQHKYVIPIESDGTAAGTSTSFIDTTMIQGSDGGFYRVTKYEDVSPTRVFMDRADYPLGKFTRIETNLNENDFLGTEGPGWFKYNKDDADKYGAKYCLMLDGYNGPNKGVGFFPTSVNDLNGSGKAEFTKIKNDFKMRTAAKHGGIVQLTQEEYDRVNEAYANSPKEDLSKYINESDKKFDIADTYPSYPSEWTVPDNATLDNNTYRYAGIKGKLTMGGGYGAESKWITVRFAMAANSNGDNIIRDAEGNSIVGYCYAKGTDGLWVGHGERSYGGSKKDNYVKRLSNYLKTEVGPQSANSDTGHTTYSQTQICTIIMENNNGTVDNYTGDYYTVKTYIDDVLLSTEYYSGYFEGIGSIETNAVQYFGNLQIFAGDTSSTPEPDIPKKDYDLQLNVKSNQDGTENILEYRFVTPDDYDADKNDVYVALYDGENRLYKVIQNKLEDSIDIDKDKDYSIKVMIWNKGTQEEIKDFNTIAKQIINNLPVN